MENYREEEVVEDTREAYNLLEQAKNFANVLWQASKEYKLVTEGFLVPENLAGHTEYGMDDIDKLDIDDPEELSHDNLVEYSDYISAIIDEEKKIKNKLESVNVSSLSENLVMYGQTIDRARFGREIIDLLEEYEDAERSIWNTDMRLRKSEKTDFNLTDRRLRRSRREVGRDGEASAEAIEYLFADENRH